LNIVQSSTSIATAAEVFFTDLGANPLRGALAGPNVIVGRCFNDISTPDSDTGALAGPYVAVGRCFNEISIPDSDTGPKASNEILSSIFAAAAVMMC